MTDQPVLPGGRDPVVQQLAWRIADLEIARAELGAELMAARLELQAARGQQPVPAPAADEPAPS